MGHRNCTGDVDTCARCSAGRDRIEDARNGVDFDPSGRMGDLAADRYEDWLMGDDR